MRKLWEKYQTGFDFWALVVYALILLPYIVYWCLPTVTGLEYGAVTTVSQIFGALSALILILVVRKEREKKLLFDSAFTSISLLIMLYLTAWIILFCGKLNFAVTLFVMISPCLALLLLAVDRKNILASVPIAVFFVLQIVATVQILLTV